MLHRMKKSMACPAYGSSGTDVVWSCLLLSAMHELL